MLSNRDLLEFDPKKKDATWADRYVTYLRMHMTYLVNPRRAKKNMAFLMGQTNMDEVKKMFKDPSKTGLQFIQIQVLEKLRNITIAEVDNAKIYISANCIDPTANNDRKRDKELLQNRSLIEASVSGMRQQIGAPPYKLSDAKDEDGRPVFKGNIEKFDEMGLDGNSPDDVQHFFDVYHRLRHEIRAEIPANIFMRLNKVQRQLPLLCNDILAKKAVAMHSYVNEMTGQVMIRVLAPEIVKCMLGRELDGTDAKALGYERVVTVSEFIELAGNDFDWDRDFNDLLTSVNYANTTEYTGVRTGDRYYGSGIRSVNMDAFYNLNVTVGYVEFKTVNGTQLKITERDFHGNPNVIKVDWDSPVSKNSSYSREERYKMITMKALYLVYSSTGQRLYKYAPVAFQKREGANDEYSAFSICISKDLGPCVVEVAEPFIIPLHKAFEKMVWMINKALPDGRAFNYSALLKLAESMQENNPTNPNTPGVSNGVAVLKLMEQFVTTGNELYDTVTDNSGNPIGGNGQPNYKIENGLSKSVGEFFTLWNQFQSAIFDYNGVSPLASGEQLPDRAGYKIQMEALQTSRKATAYVRRILNSLFEDVSTRVLSYTQDIVRYKSLFPIAYKYLEQLLGEEGVEDIDSMGDIAIHRYGTFMEAFNSQYDRQMLEMDVNQAMANKEITFEQKLLILNIDSPKQAGMVLAYQTEKARKQAIQAQQQISNNQMAQDKQRIELETELQRIKGDIILQSKKIEADGLIGAAKVTADASIKVAEMKIQAEPDKITAQADADKERIEMMMNGAN